MGVEQASSKGEDLNTCLDGLEIPENPQTVGERIIFVSHTGTHEQGKSYLARAKWSARPQTGLANTLTQNDFCLQSLTYMVVAPHSIGGNLTSYLT